jgi:tight adherence protein B
MNTQLMLFGGLAVLVSVAVVVVVASLRRLFRRDPVGSRLNTYLNIETADDIIGKSVMLAPTSSSIIHKLNDRVLQKGFAANIARDLERANVPVTVVEYILIRLAIPIGLAAVAFFIWWTPTPVILATIVGLVAPIFWMEARRKRRIRDFGDQLADTLQMVSGSLRGGFSLVQSLKHAAKESPQPTSAELERVVQEMQLGVPLGEAMDHLTERVPGEDLDLVVTAIKINARIGGNLTVVLDNVSSTIRERAKLRREVRVITSMQRLSSYIIGLLPVALILIIYTINPEYIGRLFEPGWILCIPIGAAVCALSGFLIIQKIVDIKV